MKALNGYRLLNDLGDSIFFELMPQLSLAECRKFVIEGSDVNLITRYGYSLCERVFDSFESKSSIYHRIQILFKGGLYLGSQDFNGNTIMHYCVRYDNILAAKYLKKNGASFLVENRGEYYPSDMSDGSKKVACLVRQWEYNEANRTRAARAPGKAGKT